MYVGAQMSGVGSRYDAIEYDMNNVIHCRFIHLLITGSPGGTLVTFAVVKRLVPSPSQAGNSKIRLELSHQRFAYARQSNTDKDVLMDVVPL